MPEPTNEDGDELAEPSSAAPAVQRAPDPYDSPIDPYDGERCWQIST
jgi:hypothetical protein